jgi:hypothetical protein
VLTRSDWSCDDRLIVSIVVALVAGVTVIVDSCPFDLPP